MKQLCTCIAEPMGTGGLEGYNRGDTYTCERKEKDKKGRPYWRVWPDPEGSPEYYETCGCGTFRRFFKLFVN